MAAVGAVPRRSNRLREEPGFRTEEPLGSVVSYWYTLTLRGHLTYFVWACARNGIASSSSSLRATVSQSVSKGGTYPGAGVSWNADRTLPTSSPTIMDNRNQAESTTNILASIHPPVSPSRWSMHSLTVRGGALVP